MTSHTNAERIWRKSSFSDGGNGDCVEVAFAGGVAAVRDSKCPDTGTLELGPHQWQALLAKACGR